MVPSRHSKWLQSGSCRNLGFSPVRVPSRCTGYTTYLISGCSMVAVTQDTLRPERLVRPLFGLADQPSALGQTYSMPRVVGLPGRPGRCARWLR